EHILNASSFVFSSRRRHTRSKRDWSSDVCSSDLISVASEDATNSADNSEHEAQSAATEEAVDAEESSDEASEAVAQRTPSHGKLHQAAHAVSSAANGNGPRPYSDAMTMRPAEIQARVRAGASAAELEEELGIAESRV